MAGSNHGSVLKRPMAGANRGSALDLFHWAIAVCIFSLGVGGLCITVSGRLTYPWPLEWMEGAVAHHAVRLLQGQSIYGPPAPEFISYLYPPLSYLPMAACMAVFGFSMPIARMPSIFALVASTLLLARAAQRSGGGRLGALVAAGLWALGFGYGGAFMDLARVDAVFLLLVAAGTERLTAGRNPSALLCLALSCWAKQQGLLFLVAATGWLAWADLRAHLRLLLGIWGALALSAIVMQVATDGWFGTFVFWVPFRHGVVWKLLPAYFGIDALGLLPVLSLASCHSLWRHRRDPKATHALLLAGLAASALGRAHVGGHENVLLPGFALLVVVASSTLAPVLISAHHRLPMRTGAATALVFQSVLIFQPPTVHWPTQATPPAFRRLSKSLRDCASASDTARERPPPANRGPVSVAFDHALLTGTPFVHTMALSDLLATGETPLARQAARAVLQRLASPSAPAAVAVGASFGQLDRVMAEHYRVCDALRSPPMTTGYQPPNLVIYSRD